MELEKHRLLRQDSFQDAPSSQTALFFEKNIFKIVNSREKKKSNLASKVIIKTFLFVSSAILVKVTITKTNVPYKK